MVQVMTQLAQPVRRRAPKRRGVLILIILGMLAMFGLIGLTFVMLTTHARKGAEALQKREFYVATPEKFIKETIDQITRGSLNPGSVLQNHSLLEDVYGNSFDDVTTIIATTLNIDTNGFDDDNDGTPDQPGETFPGIVDMAEAANTGGQLWEIAIPDGWRYIGRLLTMVDGPAVGKTTRIVSYDNVTGFVRVLPIPDVLIADCQDHITSTTPYTPINFIINGAAFSGTGFGLNLNAPPTSPQLGVFYVGQVSGASGWMPWDAGWTPYGSPEQPRQALFPNPVAFQSDHFDPTADYTDLSGPGCANEDYDAPDFQNMLLAMQLSDALNAGKVPSPSLHRPTLIRFWANQLDRLIDTTSMTPDQLVGAFTHPLIVRDASGFANPATDLPLILDLKRRAILRPLQEFHPDFTGSNSNYWPLWDGISTTPKQYDFDGDNLYDVDITQPEWDVDNNGDAIKDSIWVDIGLPVQTTKDGLRYKPLVAILCIDLDGRLNLNAHGSLAHIATEYGTAIDSVFVADRTSYTVERGQGWGPAEVDLSTVITDATQYENLLKGNATHPGRYGMDFWPHKNDDLQLSVGTSASVIDVLPGYDRPYDFSGYPYDYLGIAENGAIDFGSPVDLRGATQVLLDWRGQPLYHSLDAVAGTNIESPSDSNALVRQPYQLDLSPNASYDVQSDLKDVGIDMPFSPAELERILRPYDIDTMSLSDRLEKLVPGIVAPNDQFRKVTTESWDIASVPCAVTTQILQDLIDNRPADFPDRLTAKRWLDKFPAGPPQILAAQLALQNTVTTIATIETDFATTGEYLLGPELMAGLPLNLNRRFTSRTFSDGSKDLGGSIRNTFERRTMARHLYCLAMLLADLEYLNEVSWQTFRDLNATGLAALTTAEKRQYTARLLAQWAVNVVDFRSNGSVMTSFEYDVRPFEDNTPSVAAASANFTKNPTSLPALSPEFPTYVAPPEQWDVDGVLNQETYEKKWEQPSGTYNRYTLIYTSADASTNRAVVWGAARPELLITETFAMHDRRTTDADSDGDFDQRWQPEGSLFVELYNPWTKNEAPPFDLYVKSPAGPGVDLTKVTQESTVSPVWRLAITECLEPTASLTAPAIDDNNVRIDMNHSDVSPTDRRPPASTTRAVYFSPEGMESANNDPLTLPGGVASELQPSQNMTSIAPVVPGRYALIGPGNPADSGTSTTVFGLRTTLGITPGNNTELAQTRRITLTPNVNPNVATPQVDIYGDGNAEDLTTAPVLDTIQKPTSIVINFPRRLSATEPYTGYAVNDGSGVAYDPATGYNTPYDEPLDVGDFWDDLPNGIALKDTRTFPGVFVVHLQRLANPEQAYNAETNPYLTLDTMPVDVTAFNGVTNQGSTANVKLFARERGTTNLTSNRTKPNPWSQEPIANFRDDPRRTQTSTRPPTPDPAPTIAKTVTDHYLDSEFSHSLGYLNGSYRRKGDSPLHLTYPKFMGSTPWPLSERTALDNEYRGAPENPFPWLNWNNRPFVSKNELLLVPATPSSRLLRSYGFVGSATSTPYEPDTPTTNLVADRANQNFPHLMNFFNSLKVSGGMGGPTKASEMHRILDYVRVPSRFVKTREPIMDTGFTDLEIADKIPETIRELTDRREPGRVNLNTITSEEVFDAVQPSDLPNLFGWGRFQDSRLGNNVGGNQLTTNHRYPARVLNPFRGTTGLDLTPTTRMRNNINRKVNTTLLREYNAGGPSLAAGNNTTACNNTERNPYFKYQTLNRLGNIAGTRSNVYAVWITVGYFEVEPVIYEDDGGVDKTLLCPQADFPAYSKMVYPDGVRIGQEVGADTGEVKRHRAFYMIDRSIPVGFKRGENLNVEKTILLKRFIE